MRTRKIPRAILEKVRCICEPAFIASCFPLPDPIRQVVEVNDMYLNKVMAPLWTRRRYMTPTFTTISIYSKVSRNSRYTVPNGCLPRYEARSKIVATRSIARYLGRKRDRGGIEEQSQKIREAQRRQTILQCHQTAKICTVYRWSIPQNDGVCLAVARNRTKTMEEDICLGKVTSAVAKSQNCCCGKSLKF
jgi:hypothetical protein